MKTLKELAHKHLPDGFEDDAQRQRQRGAIIERSTKPDAKRLRWWWFAATSALVATSVAVILVYMPANDASDLVGRDGVRFAQASWIDARGEDRHLAQGSHELVLRDGARMRANVLNRKQVHLDLSAGALDLRIDPERQASWKISAGPYDVLVVGTILAVDWKPDDNELRVPVRKGEVMVRENAPARRSFRILAGEEFVADEQGVRVERRVRVQAPVRAQTAPAVDRIGNKRARTKGARPNPPAWKDYALQGDFPGAMQSIEVRGFDETLAQTRPDSLLLLGDVARLSGNASKAELAYRRIAKDASRHRDAQAARFRLGRLLADNGRHSDAALWFSQYLDFAGAKPLEEEANGRLFDSLLKSDQAEEAKLAAKRYLDRGH
ncbi:MAG: tetratricopeptide repeat protein, partial [Myxococcota bacterium]